MFKVGDLVEMKSPAVVGKKELCGVVVPCPEKYREWDWAVDPKIIWIQFPESFSKIPRWSPIDEVKLVEVVRAPVVKRAPISVAKKPFIDTLPAPVVNPKAPKAPKKEKEVVKVRRRTAHDIIMDQKGKFFTVKFKGKHDGANHSCNGRTNVVKYLKDRTKQIDQPAEDLINAFNVHKMEYRNIFLDGVLSISAGGKVYSFE